MCLFERAAGRRPDRKGEKTQGYTRVRPEQLGRSGPLPGRGYRQKLRLVRSFCFPGGSRQAQPGPGIFICGSGRTSLQMIPEVSGIVPAGAAADRPPDWFD